MANVKLKNLSKRYGNDVLAVSDLSLDIEDKEFVIFVGPSGCGKTTTLRMIAGLEDITEGELYIGDHMMNDVAPKDRDIAMVFQNYALYPHMSVYDNMAFGLKLRKTLKSEIIRRVHEAAKILDIGHLLERKPKALSGGQRQRVAMGRAIVREPKVFLMDEPLSNLDAKLRVQMRTEITKLYQRLGTTFIYVTHDQTEAMTLGTRIVVMDKGVVQQVDAPLNLYEHPANLFVAGFIGSPQMNQVEVAVEASGNECYLIFAEHRIKLPLDKAQALISGGYPGKSVILGIRPEDLHEEDSYTADAETAILNTEVEVTELMGAEAFLYVICGGKEFTARGNPRTKARPNDKLKLLIDLRRIHLFDKETEQVITAAI
ncbi:MAG: sn-glycerol-3-phosphate ABC transporter ATP-binding protein UgpC [Peptococcaceae bacterium]|jgi:multiple sugar transport system ATP-binding protein|nr:sn-glycerol-3-phosphate ABC transporter ATP-binding protein UgpC [Peptococcaceae bacterium]